MKRINNFFLFGLLLLSLTFCEKEISEPENSPDNSQEYEFKYIDTVSIGYLTDGIALGNYHISKEILLLFGSPRLSFMNDTIKENNISTSTLILHWILNHHITLNLGMFFMQNGTLLMKETMEGYYIALQIRKIPVII